MLSLNALLGIIALVLAVVAIVRSWASPWSLALPVAVLLLSIIHVMGVVAVP